MLRRFATHLIGILVSIAGLTHTVDFDVLVQTGAFQERGQIIRQIFEIPGRISLGNKGRYRSQSYRSQTFGSQTFGSQTFGAQNQFDCQPQPHSPPLVLISPSDVPFGNNGLNAQPLELSTLPFDQNQMWLPRVPSIDIQIPLKLPKALVILDSKLPGETGPPSTAKFNLLSGSTRSITDASDSGDSFIQSGNRAWRVQSNQEDGFEQIIIPSEFNQRSTNRFVVDVWGHGWNTPATSIASSLQTLDAQEEFALLHPVPDFGGFTNGRFTNGGFTNVDSSAQDHSSAEWLAKRMSLSDQDEIMSEEVSDIDQGVTPIRESDSALPYQDVADLEMQLTDVNEDEMLADSASNWADKELAKSLQETPALLPALEAYDPYEGNAGLQNAPLMASPLVQPQVQSSLSDSASRSYRPNPTPAVASRSPRKSDRSLAVHSGQTLPLIQSKETKIAAKKSGESSMASWWPLVAIFLPFTLLPFVFSDRLIDPVGKKRQEGFGEPYVADRSCSKSACGSAATAIGASGRGSAAPATGTALGSCSIATDSSTVGQLPEPADSKPTHPVSVVETMKIYDEGPVTPEKVGSAAAVAADETQSHLQQCGLNVFDSQDIETQSVSTAQEIEFDEILDEFDDEIEYEFALSSDHQEITQNHWDSNEQIRSKADLGESKISDQTPAGSSPAGECECCSPGRLIQINEPLAGHDFELSNELPVTFNINQGADHDDLQTELGILDEINSIRTQTVYAQGSALSADTSTARQSGRDDLTKINGIGKATHRLLRKNGINTFEALALSKTEDLQKILSKRGKQFEKNNCETWTAQALLALEGDWEALADFEKSLS